MSKVNQSKKKLIKELDEISDKMHGENVTYKQWVKHTLHAVELYFAGVRSKDIK